MFESSVKRATPLADELLAAVRSAHQAAAAAQATEVLAAAALHQARGACDAEFASAEIALAVGSTEAAAAGLVQTGLALEHGLPATREAFLAGHIDLARVRVIVEVTADLPEPDRAGLEPRLVAAARTSNPAALRQTARRWAIRQDPAGAQQRREKREAARTISIRASRDGTAALEAQLPAIAAQTLGARLREMSLQVCKRDPRTKMQRRVDAILALADGSGRLVCGCGRGGQCPALGPAQDARETLIHVGISAESLAGLRADPAYLSGYGPIDPALARGIARRARIEPSRQASGHQQLAQGCVCRFPGCVASVAGDSPPASTPNGTTGPSIALCDHHSRLSAQVDNGKSRWQIRHHAGRLDWITPGGTIASAPSAETTYLFAVSPAAADSAISGAGSS